MDEETIRLARILHETARQMGGRILNSVAVIDVQLAEIISHYFYDRENRRALFMSEIATSHFFSLRSKEAILKKIVGSECSFFLENDPGLFKEFENIRNLRNDLAHATIDVSREALLRGSTSAGFVSFRDGVPRVRTVTQAEADDYDPTWTAGRDFAIENGRNAGG
jgi:hypothetical protein